MSRIKIQKLQEGNKIEKPKTNVFKTARGDVNYDLAKGNILSFADSELEALGIPKEYIPQARQYLGEELSAIDKGEITALDNAGKLVNTINLKDYSSNYTPKTSGSSFWGTKKRVWDEDALRNASRTYLVKSLERADLYNATPESASKEKKSKPYEYTWSPFESDVARTAFRGGDFDLNVWNNWKDSDKLKYINTALKDKLGYLEGLDSEALANTDFNTIHGYKDSAGYTTALRNAISNTERGVADESMFDSMRQLGLGNINQWWKNNAPATASTESKAPWSTSPEYSKYNISDGVSRDGFRIGKDSEGNTMYFTQDESGNWIPQNEYVYSNPFEVDNWNKVVYKGKLYNNVEEVSQANPNDDLSTIYSMVERNNKRINPEDSYVNNNPLSKTFVSRKNSVLGQNFVWEDNKFRDLVTDYSNEFSGLKSGNTKLFAFANQKDLQSGKPVQEYLLYDKNKDSYNKVKIEERNGVYFAKDINGKSYNLGSFNKNWMPNVGRDFDNILEGQEGYAPNPTRINRRDFTNNTYTSGDDVAITLNDLMNYSYSDEDRLAFINSLDRTGYNKPLTFRADALSDESQTYRLYKPLIEKLKLRPQGTGQNQAYRITINDLRRYLGLPENTQKERSIFDVLSGNRPFGMYQKGGTIASSSIYQPKDSSAQNISQKTNYKVSGDDFATVDMFSSLTGAEKTKLIASIGDFGSIAASFIPGANLGAAGIGAASSLTRFGANIADDGLDIGDVGELGLDLALDAVSLVPGAKIAKAPKLLKGMLPILKKALPIGGAIIAGGATIANSDQLLSSLDKISKEGVTSLTTNEWKTLATALGAIASGRASVKMLGDTKGVTDFNRLSRKVFYKDSPGKVSSDATAKIKIGDSEFDVPVSKGIQESYQGVKKATASDFNSKVRTDINSQVDSYVENKDGINTLKEGAPDWVKQIFNSGKTGNDWNFETVKTKRGLWKGQEVANISSNSSITGGNLRRMFRPGAIDLRTAEQLDQGFNPRQLFNFNRSYQNYSKPSISTPVPKASSANTETVSETTKPVVDLGSRSGLTYSPLRNNATGRPSLLEYPRGFDQSKLNPTEVLKGANIGDVRKTTVDGQSIYLQQTDKGVRQLTEYQYLESILKNRNNVLEQGRLKRQDNILLGKQIGEVREARQSAVEKLRRISLGSEIANTRESRIKTKQTMTERFNREANNEVNYEAKPRTKGEPKKQSKRTDTGIRKHQLGGLFASSKLLQPIANLGRNSLNIKPVSTLLNPVSSSVDISSVIPKPNQVSRAGIGGVEDIDNTSSFNINPSSLLSAGTLGLGLHYNKKTYDAARRFKPTLIDAPQISARMPSGNLQLEQFYRNQGNDLLRRLNRTATSDQNLNTAMMLEGSRQANELAEKGALANDQEIRRTTELADRITAQNTMARTEAANQNRASLLNAENMKNDLEARYIGNKWGQLISPYLTEMRNDWKQKESLGRQINLEGLNQITQQDYQDQMFDLQSRMRNAEAAYKGSVPFTSTADYRNFLRQRNALQNQVRKDMLGNQKTLLNTFKTGGVLKRIQDFNRGLLNADKQALKSIQHSMDQQVKENRFNIKLAKNLLTKLK